MRHTVANLLGRVLPLGVGLITIPATLIGLGVERFALLTIIWIFFGNFALFDLGLSRSVTKFVSQRIGDGSGRGSGAIFWSAALIQCGVGTAIGIAIAVAAKVWATRLFDIPVPLQHEATLSFILCGVALPILLLGGSTRGLLEATGNFLALNAIKSPASTFGFIIPLLAALFGFGLPAILVGLILVRLTEALSYYLIARVLIDGLWPPVFLPIKEQIPLFKFGGWVAISSMVSPLLVYLDRFVIGSAISLVALAYYATPSEMMLRFLIVPASLVAVLFPTISRIGSHDAAAVEKHLWKAVKFVVLFVLPPLAILFALSPLILSTWLGPEFSEGGKSLVRVLAFGILLNSVAFVPFTVIQGLGRADLTGRIHLLEIPIYVLTLFMLTTHWGLLGAAIAWSLRAAIDLALLLIATSWVNKLHFQEFDKERIPRLLAIMFSAVILIVGVSSLLGSTAGLVITAALTLLLPILIWKTCLDPEDRYQLRSIVMSRPIDGKIAE